jgi:prolyl 3-hydroxylase /prolyl 3,4-dihydroxylase
MSIVLRDSGVLKFVKFISRKAAGDRWDISGAFDVRLSDDDDEDGAEDEKNCEVALEDSEEETINGSLDSDETDSD